MTQLDDNFKKVIKESGIPYLKLNGVYDLQHDLEKVDHELMDFMQKHMGNDVNGNNNEMDLDKYCSSYNNGFF